MSGEVVDGLRPEIRALIDFATASGAEAAYRTVVSALEQTSAMWAADGKSLRQLRAGDVLPGIIYATSKAADEAAAEAAKHAPDAGWALA